MLKDFLLDKNLQEFINKLKINDEQKKFLFDELPAMDTKDRLELLDTLKDVYVLNQEEAEEIKKLEDNWK
jgi:hypothetical protein